MTVISLLQIQNTPKILMSIYKVANFFKIRSAEQIKELQNLSPLPETQKEITEVAKFFSDRNKKLLLGKNASELNFRLTDFTNYDFLHFAVHGLVSGNFSGLENLH